jgi:hypothetical protein
VAACEGGTAARARDASTAGAGTLVELGQRAIVASALLALVSAPVSAQPAHHVGPSYLYPDAAVTPSVVNPKVTQANITTTICQQGWTATIRPPVSYTNTLKRQQLAAPRCKDKTPSHYEEDHFIALELGGHPRHRKNLWPEMWGTPATPLTSRGPFPPHLIGAKAKDATERALNKAVCDGSLTLQEAQQIIATDWFKYYRDQVLK